MISDPGQQGTIRRVASPDHVGAIQGDDGVQYTLMHQRKVVKEACLSLIGAGIVLYYLPASRPELNDIKINGVFGAFKRHSMPESAYGSSENCEKP